MKQPVLNEDTMCLIGIMKEAIRKMSSNPDRKELIAEVCKDIAVTEKLSLY